MSTGKVKFFNESKGFGFITPDDGSNDLFVHISSVQSASLSDGDSVQYELGETPKGLCAVQVNKL